MCGRYASSRDAGDLVDEFEVDQLRIDALLPKSWNVAPTDPVYAVLDRPPRPDRPRERQLRELTWGC
ncbi:SOS response-associated peptidase family protein [Nocardioides sp.]|uniref:SOS response-associated peptidase family protein n=1 Tax=Nocardioides sp. TaxID=35761 RepID=UPI0039E68BF0